jgi:hypothetical protein
MWARLGLVRLVQKGVMLGLMGYSCLALEWAGSKWVVCRPINLFASSSMTHDMPLAGLGMATIMLCRAHVVPKLLCLLRAQIGWLI